jgi:hypothetical protein
MRTVTVNVTQEDIDRRRPRSQCGCPLATAISRAVGEPMAVFNTDVGPQAGGYYVNLPPDAFDFRRAFDAGRAVRPIAFPLRVPVTTEAK